MLASSLWQCLAFPSLLQLCWEPILICFLCCPRNTQNLSQSFHLLGFKTCFFILFECLGFTAVRGHMGHMGDWKRETGKHGTKLQDWKMREKACMESQMSHQSHAPCLKNVLPSTCYRPNLDIHNPITIIFDRSVTKKVRNQTMLCCPTSPASALPCEIKTQKTARWCIVCATQSNCCSAVDLYFLLNHAPILHIAERID